MITHTSVAAVETASYGNVLEQKNCFLLSTKNSWLVICNKGEISGRVQRSLHHYRQLGFEFFVWLNLCSVNFTQQNFILNLKLLLTVRKLANFLNIFSSFYVFAFFHLFVFSFFVLISIFQLVRNEIF